MARKSRYYRRTFALLLVTASAIGFTGCKSSMPSMKWMSWNKPPEPETLAGKGPSSTYPTPGSTQTPSAIASNAAGNKPKNPGAPKTVDPAMGYTAPANYAGVAPKTGAMPGSVTPAGSTSGASFAAAQANGFVNNTPYVPGGASAIPGAISPVTGSATADPNHLGSNGLALGGAPSSALPQMPPSASSSPSIGAPAGYANASTPLPPIMKAPVPAISPSAPTPYSLPSRYAPPSGIASTAPNTNGGFALPTAIPPTAGTAPAMTPGTDSGYRTATANGPAFGYGTPPSGAGQTDSSGTMTNPYARPQPTPNTSSGSGYRPGSTNRSTGYSIDNPGGSVYR